MKHIPFKNIYLLLIPFILIIIGAAYLLGNRTAGIDIQNPPKFIQASFIDLSKIYSISKFRSSAGHDFSEGNESCRSMKHYFVPQKTSVSSNKNQIPPAPTGGPNDIAIYSPVDGAITQITSEQTPIGRQIYIIPYSQPHFTIRLFHIYTLKGIEVNTHVTAGEQIGWISNLSDTDISIETNNQTQQSDARFLSYFSVMPDTLFNAYIQRGATSRNDFIISKEYRDAHPLQCAQNNSQAFIYPSDYNEANDYVTLSGYIKPVQIQTNIPYTGNQGNTNKK